MDEEEFNLKLARRDLVISQTWKKIRTQQLEMILGLAKNNSDSDTIRAMLKLIAKTDDWELDFKKAQANR